MSVVILVSEDGTPQTQPWKSTCRIRFSGAFPLYLNSRRSYVPPSSFGRLQSDNTTMILISMYSSSLAALAYVWASSSANPDGAASRKNVQLSLAAVPQDRITQACAFLPPCTEQSSKVGAASEHTPSSSLPGPIRGCLISNDASFPFDTQTFARTSLAVSLHPSTSQSIASTSPLAAYTSVA